MTQFTNVRENVAASSLDRADVDFEETTDWLDALNGVVMYASKEREQYVVDRLAEHTLSLGIESTRARTTPYINTVTLAQQPRYSGNLQIEEKLAGALRWNALAMVVRANRAYGELGGHIASYASAADLFEVDFSHFFRASTRTQARARQRAKTMRSLQCRMST